MAGAIAHLNAEDQPDGSIRMQAVYIGGYDAKSPSHQAVRMAQAYLDSLMTRLSEPEERHHHANGEVEVVPVGEGMVPLPVGVDVDHDQAATNTMNLPEGALIHEGRA